MKTDFDNASIVESVVWQMRLAEYPRGLNRSLINDMANGLPPYTDEEVRDNNIEVNVNTLGHTKLCHDGRSQFYNAFMKPGRYFVADTDYGKPSEREKFKTIVNREATRLMKRNLIYFETHRSKFAQLVLHGISPCAWNDKHTWWSDSKGVEDVLVPANTKLTMTNLPFLAIYEQYTGAQLRRMISGPKVDPGWNLDLCEQMIQWVDQEASKLCGTAWPEVWSPEKMSERIKGDGGLYASDAVPTIDCYRFLFYHDDGKKSGWYQRIILDSYGQPGVGPDGAKTLLKGSNKYGEDKKGRFLYNSNERKYADNLSEVIGWQFADLSAVGPFKYHSVRSLGWLVWAVCHLQNRLYCRLQEHTFETLMQYFMVSSAEDAERALKVELVNRGFIDPTIKMIPRNERWAADLPMAEFAYGQNQQIINENSSSYVQNQNFSRDRVEKTKFQVMAEVNAMTQLVSSALMQAYRYQTAEYQEIFRRFCRPNSRDKDVREFRASCFRQGVPEKLLEADKWDISAEQVMGAGNKTMEMAIAQQLLEMRNLYDPEPQRKILRNVTLAVTDNPSLTDDLVPEAPETVSRWTREAQQSVATILEGLPVVFESGADHIQIVETWLSDMQMLVQQAEQQGGMADGQRIMGMQNLAAHIQQQMQIIARDENERQRVKMYGDALGKMMNMVKAYAQRLQQAMEKQQQDGNAGLDPKDMAKIQATMLTAQAKVQNMRESHGMRTAERQIAFEAKQQQQKQQHDLEMQHELQTQQVQNAVEAIKTDAEIKRESAKAVADAVNVPIATEE